MSLSKQQVINVSWLCLYSLWIGKSMYQAYAKLGIQGMLIFGLVGTLIFLLIEGVLRLFNKRPFPEFLYKVNYILAPTFIVALLLFSIIRMFV